MNGYLKSAEFRALANVVRDVTAADVLNGEWKTVPLTSVWLPLPSLKSLNSQFFYFQCQVFFNLLFELAHLLFLSKKPLNLLFFLTFLELILFTSIERWRLYSLFFWWYLSNNCLKYLFPHHLIRYFLKLWQIGVSIRPFRFRSRFLFRTHFKLFLCQLYLSEAFTWFMAWLKVEIVIICALSWSTLI